MEENEKLLLQSESLDYFDVIITPASGPRSFCTMGFDLFTLKSQIPQQRKWLIGGSTGALRSIALVASKLTGENLIEYLVEHYSEMIYQHGDSPETLKNMMYALYEKIAPPALIRDILNHPEFDIGIIVTNIKKPYCDYSDGFLKIYFLTFGLLSLVNSTWMNKFMSRIIFTTNKCNFIRETDDIEFASLTEDNFYDVIHATCGIPFVQTRCDRIGEDFKGLFMDAALTNYMLNIEIMKPMRALFLHDYTNQDPIRQRFIDLYVPWKRTPRKYFTNCSIIGPTKAFKEALPEKNLPSVGDWFETIYIDSPQLRQQNWLRAYQLSCKVFKNYKPNF
jgi:hypothetical protein